MVGAGTGKAELPSDSTPVQLRLDEMLARPPSVEPVDILAMKNQLASLRPVSRGANSPCINPG
jgi:hypothetical protein